MSIEERLVELEVGPAYQDNSIADRDEVVRTFTERLQNLERELELPRETAMNNPPPTGAADDPSPHY